MEIEGNPPTFAGAQEDEQLSSRKTGDEATTTAFRAAEKHYQLKREQVWKKKGGRLRGVGLAALPTDFSGVLDLELAAPSSCGSHQSQRQGPRGWGDALHPQDTLPTAASVSRVAESCGLEFHEGPGCSAPRGIFSFGRFPGLYVVPGALSEQQQEDLLRECLTVMPEPPSRSNHSVHLGELPGLWTAARGGLRLQKRDPLDADEPTQSQQEDWETAKGQCRRADGPGWEPGQCSSCGSPSGPSLGCCRDCFDATWSAEGKGQEAVRLLDRLRWVTIGPQFLWTPRVYDMEGPYQPVPATLQAFAAQLEQVTWRLMAGTAGKEEEKEADGAWEEGGFRPEACLVNYYGEGDTLNGHRDDVEPDQSLPIISISLGCSAVFLVGGDTLDTPPTPILLRGGDAVVLGAKARRCCHGVPRVLSQGRLTPSAVQGRNQGIAEEDDRAALRRYAQVKRINLSIRTIT